MCLHASASVEIEKTEFWNKQCKVIKDQEQSRIIPQTTATEEERERECSTSSSLPWIMTSFQFCDRGQRDCTGKKRSLKRGEDMNIKHRVNCENYVERWIDAVTNYLILQNPPISQVSRQTSSRVFWPRWFVSSTISALYLYPCRNIFFALASSGAFCLTFLWTPAKLIAIWPR